LSLKPIHFFLLSDFEELFRDIAEVREAVKKELARNFNSNKNDVIIGEDEEELVMNCCEQLLG
jgi:hypothetical protein